MNKKTSKILWVAFFGLFVLVSSVIIHESTHITIFKEYGIDDYSLVLGSEGIGVRPNETEWKALDTQTQRDLRNAQAQVENVGYQFLPILMMLFLIYVEVALKND